MSTTGLWIVTGIEGLLILGLGAFGWMASQGLTRIVVKTGKELGDKIAEVSDEIPKIVENVIEKGGDALTANVAGAATSQVSSLTGDATGKGLEMMPKMPAIPPTPEVPAEAAGSVPATAEEQAGGGKQTKGNKPKKIRKPRTKKNIKKVGNQMYMNFSL